MSLKDLFVFRDHPGGFESVPPGMARITSKAPHFKTPPGFFGLFVSRPIGLSSAQHKSETRAETVVPPKSGSGAAMTDGLFPTVAKTERMK